MGLWRNLCHNWGTNGARNLNSDILAELFIEPPKFVGWEGPSNADLAGLVLLFVGEKTAIEWNVEAAAGLPEDVVSVCAFLGSMGLASAVVRRTPTAALVLMARDRERLADLEAVWRGGSAPSSTELKRLHGHLSGFPESAIEAFLAGRSLDPSEIPEDVRLTDAYAIGRFRYSPEHLRDELETGMRWGAAIRAASPHLHRSVLATAASVEARLRRQTHDVSTA